MTLVVNLFGGPGVSKSTNAALTFGKLKIREVAVEMAHEYAKDLTWEERHRAIRFQPYVAAKQIWRVHRLLGQVDVIITDSPILLSAVYKGEGYTHAFHEYIFDTFNSWNTLNLLLQRDNDHHRYVQKGRTQTFTQAMHVDDEIKHMLATHGIKYTNVPVQEGEATSNVIIDHILKRLENEAD